MNGYWAVNWFINVYIVIEGTMTRMLCTEASVNAVIYHLWKKKKSNP